MDSYFVTTLRKVKSSKDDYPEAPAHLEGYLWDIQEKLKERIPTSENQFKKFAEHGFNQIINERLRIEECLQEYYKELNSKRKNLTLTVYEAEILQEEIDYYRDILYNIDTAANYLLRYLIAYYPENYRGKYYIDLIKERFGNLSLKTDDVLSQFLAECDFLEKGPRNCPPSVRTDYFYFALYYYYIGRKTKIIISKSKKSEYYCQKLAKENGFKSGNKLSNEWGKCNYINYRIKATKQKKTTLEKHLEKLKKEILPALKDYKPGSDACQEDIVFLEKEIKRR